MSADVGRDQLVLIRIEGMHCHKCEQSIRQALSQYDGVHEVEVDFNSGQASVLFDRGDSLMAALAGAHMNIPVAHIQAGERSGNIDGLTRHAIARGIIETTATAKPL